MIISESKRLVWQPKCYDLPCVFPTCCSTEGMARTRSTMADGSKEMLQFEFMVKLMKVTLMIICCSATCLILGLAAILASCATPGNAPESWPSPRSIRAWLVKPVLVNFGSP